MPKPSLGRPPASFSISACGCLCLSSSPFHRPQSQVIHQGDGQLALHCQPQGHAPASPGGASQPQGRSKWPGGPQPVRLGRNAQSRDRCSSSGQPDGQQRRAGLGTPRRAHRRLPPVPGGTRRHACCCAARRMLPQFLTCMHALPPSLLCVTVPPHTRRLSNCTNHLSLSGPLRSCRQRALGGAGLGHPARPPRKRGCRRPALLRVTAFHHPRPVGAARLQKPPPTPDLVSAAAGAG